VFVLARHAHAGDKPALAGLDDDRPLTALGRNQAAHLVDLLPTSRYGAW
jgi:broad specificity phosphatase PhoE